MKNNRDYLPRIIDKRIDLYLHTFGAVCIEGPKWCGKTMTSSHHSKSEIYLGDPDGNFQNRRLAQMAPSLVLEGEYPRLIDEWQEVPELWDAVRFSVDKSQIKGQYILTGSATPNHKGILHSGTGRIASIRMQTMSLFESKDSSGLVSLKSIIDGDFSPVMTGEVNLMQLIELIVRGGWPASIGLSLQNAVLLPKSYMENVITEDIFKVDGIKRDISKIRLLLRSLARNESTTVTNKKLKNDIKSIDDEDINIDTIADYLNLFNRLFITDNLKPFSSNIRSSLRIKQSEKRHFTDPSLACALLNITPQMLINDLNTLGFLFESMCLRDLRIYAESSGGKLYHYQDYDNNEIDAVIEAEDGKWYAFEIKLGANQIDEAARNLKHIYDKLAKSPETRLPSAMVVICGLSNAAYRRDDGIYVIPVTALKD